VLLLFQTALFAAATATATSYKQQPPFSFKGAIPKTSVGNVVAQRRID